MSLLRARESPDKAGLQPLFVQHHGHPRLVIDVPGVVRICFAEHQVHFLFSHFLAHFHQHVAQFVRRDHS